LLSKGRSILLVDDEADIINSIKRWLQADGFKVYGFTNPLQALEYFPFRNKNNGSIIYKGITIFNSDATEDMAFLNNLVGLHIIIVQDNNQATKIWKWQ